MPLPLSFHFILLAIHLFFPPLGLSEPKTMYRMRWDGTKWHSWGGVRRCPTFPNALPFSPPCPSTPGSGSSDDKENKIFLVWFYGIYAIFLIASVLLFFIKIITILEAWFPFMSLSNNDELHLRFIHSAHTYWVLAGEFRTDDTSWLRQCVHQEENCIWLPINLWRSK